MQKTLENQLTLYYNNKHIKRNDEDKQLILNLSENRATAGSTADEI